MPYGYPYSQPPIAAPRPAMPGAMTPMMGYPVAYPGYSPMAAMYRPPLAAMPARPVAVVPPRAPMPGAPNPAAPVAAPPPRQVLGDHLFPVITRICPEHAPKITGMILELDQNEVVALLGSEALLRRRVEEALAVLRSEQAQPQPQT